MKSLKTLTTLALTFSALSAAQALPALASPAPQTAIPSDAIALVPVQGRLTGTHGSCPQGAMCLTNQLIASIEFALPGCLDELAPVSYAVELSQNGDHAAVYTSAYAITRKASTVAKCFQQNKKVVNVILPSFPQKVEVLSAPTFSQSPAKSIPLKGASALVSLEGTLKGTHASCPKGAMCITNQLTAEVSFEVSCSEQLLPVAYKVTPGQQDDQQSIHYAAIAVSHVQPGQLQCQSIKQEVVKLPLPSFGEKVELLPMASVSGK